MEKTTHFFWGEIAPSDHLLQIYETDIMFIDALFSYVKEGIDHGESAVIIATEDHLNALNLKMSSVYDVNSLIDSRKYLPIDAEKLLDRLLENDEISEIKFNAIITDLLNSVNCKKAAKVRILGEMVALLWGMGYRKATMQLEKLWSKFCSSNNISLVCAYPQAGFRQDAVKSIMHICTFHSKLEKKNISSPELMFYGEKFSIGAA